MEFGINNYMKKILLLFVATFFMSCALTYETTPRHQCELMLRGEKCLSDHRCCKPSQTYHYQQYPTYNWWWLTRTNTTNYVIVKPNKPNKPNKPRKPKTYRHRK